MKILNPFLYTIILLFIFSCNNKRPAEVRLFESCGVLIGQEDCYTETLKNRWFISLEESNLSKPENLVYQGKLYQNVTIINSNLPLSTENYEIGKKYKFQYEVIDTPYQTICILGKTNTTFPIIVVTRISNCN